LCSEAGLDVVSGALTKRVSRAGSSLVWWFFGSNLFIARRRRSLDLRSAAALIGISGRDRKLPAHLQVHRRPGRGFSQFHGKHQLQHVATKGLCRGTGIRRWYRGDAGVNERGEPYDCHWCPAPADVRQIAMSELWRLKSRIENLKNLLRAEPLIEFTDEHCHAMRVRLSALMHETFGIPLVGKDGSSGTISEG
jgi:hypothetical protein